MKNINRKNGVYMLVVVSFIAFFLLFWIKGIEGFTSIEALKLIPKVVSIDVLLISIFSTHFWKSSIFRGWLVAFPNMNGTWKGTIQTTWIDPVTGKRPAPIPAILTIKQSLFNISCVMRTAEMTSRSVIADFYCDKDNQIMRLAYTYDSNPIATVKERSPQHLGTMLFDIIESPIRRIDGEYWTGRRTTGNIQMEFWKKEKLNSYPKELGAHPVSESRSDTK